MPDTKSRWGNEEGQKKKMPAIKIYAFLIIWILMLCCSRAFFSFQLQKMLNSFFILFSSNGFKLFPQIVSVRGLWWCGYLMPRCSSFLLTQIFLWFAHRAKGRISTDILKIQTHHSPLGRTRAEIYKYILYNNRTLDIPDNFIYHTIFACFWVNWHLCGHTNLQG